MKIFTNDTHSNHKVYKYNSAKGFKTPYDSIQFSINVHIESVNDDKDLELQCFYIDSDTSQQKSDRKICAVSTKRETTLQEAKCTGIGWCHRKFSTVVVAFSCK